MLHERRSEDVRLRNLEIEHTRLRAETRGQSKILGRILLEVKDGRKESRKDAEASQQHFIDDAKQHARIDKVEKDVKWMRSIGMTVATMLGIGHFFK